MLVWYNYGVCVVKKNNLEIKKKIMNFLNSIIKSASSNEEDEVNVAIDLLALTFDFLPDEKKQKILDFIGEEYKVVPPKFFTIDELPF